MSHKNKKILVHCMEGIGDQIYMRPFIRLLSEENDVHLETVLPQLFSDLNVTFIERPDSLYRTQKKSKDKELQFSKKANKYDLELRTNYTRDDLSRYSIVSHFERVFGFPFGSTDPVFDLPRFDCHSIPLPPGKKIAIIRPVTIRSEWKCLTRPPNPSYIAWCAKELRAAGYYTISIADTEKDLEWIDGEVPVVDLALNKGELSIFRTFSLMQEADIVVGGSGFIIPAVMSMEKPSLFCIFGGRGMYDNPGKLFSFKANMQKIGWAIPDKFCRCDRMEHNCDKTISNLDSLFYTFLKEHELLRNQRLSA